MRLLHFAESGAVVGGVERYLQALLAAPLSADGTGLEHAVVTHGDGPCEYAGSWPAAVWPWLGPHTSAGPGPALDGAVPLFHAPPSPAALADLARAPFAVFCHDHKWWCPSATRFYLRPRTPCGIRASTMACGVRYHAKHCGSMRPAATVSGFARADIARDTLARAAAVLCASHFMAREAVRHGARPETVRVVPLPSPIVPDPDARHDAGVEPVILSASRLTPEKGIVELVDAFSLVRTPARLIIAGEGIGEEAVRQAVDALPMRGRITLAGRLADDAMRDAMAAAAVVAVPSLWPEPFGMAGIEALALGKPVVSSGMGGMSDWAMEEHGVLTADPSDAAAFALALDRALTEPQWTLRARADGATWVARRHGMAAHVTALTEALAGLALKEAA